MDGVKELFDESDCWMEVQDAWAFSMEQVFVYFDIASENAERQASLLARVDLTSKAPTWEVLASFDFGAAAYRPVSADEHRVLTSGGNLFDVRAGEVQSHESWTDLLLRGFEPLGGGAALLYGEDGAIFRFEGGTAQRLDSTTDEELLGAHCPRPDAGLVCGTNGTLLRWNGTSLSRVVLEDEEVELEAVHQTDDGTILLGANDGSGLVMSGGETTQVGKADGGIQSIATFKGVEYWGDDDFGIYVREGEDLVEKFETEGAFRLNATADVLTVVNAAEVYLFDGSDWAQLHTIPSKKKLVSRVPLDFTPK